MSRDCMEKTLALITSTQLRFYQLFFYQLIIILGLLSKEGLGVSLEEDVTLTWEQKTTLDRFKNLVEERLTHDYMKSDIYLVRWLRARDFNIEQAERMLLENLNWRNMNKMDTIQNEDWSDMNLSYKYWVNGFDKQGQPIAFFNLAEWDLRQAVVSGKSDRLYRYIDKAIDEVSIAARRELDLGKNVTQFNLVVNLDGYSPIEQGCLQCIPVYIHLVSSYENHFPGNADKLILVNTPAIFEIILNAIRPFMSPLTRRALKVYGSNRNSWDKILYKDIERDQLPKEVGGTAVYPEF